MASWNRYVLCLAWPILLFQRVDLAAAEALPSVSISDVVVEEGDEGLRGAKLVVRLSEPLPEKLVLSFATVDYTAVSSEDYQPHSGVLTFLAGETEQAIEVFLSGDEKVEPTEVFFVDLTGGSQIDLTKSRGVCSVVSDDLGRRGGKIAFDSQASHQRCQAIYVMNADGSELCQLTDGVTIDRVPEFSPDGFQIAFVSWRDGNSEIYVMNADGSSPRRMTSHGAVDSYPRFSPDGKWLVFFSDRAGSNDIYLLPVDGSLEPQQLTTDPGNDCDPAFAPDGSWITFSSDRSGSYDILAMDLEGKDQRKLTESPGEDIHSTVSPDGTQITFRSSRTGNFENYVMAVDGSYVTQLTSQGGSVRHPSFSPDGKSVIFHVVSKPGAAVIQTVEIRTGVVRNLTGDAASNLNAVWAPGEVERSLMPVRERSLFAKLRTYRPRYLVTRLAISVLLIACLWGVTRVVMRRRNRQARTR